MRLTAAFPFRHLLIRVLNNMRRTNFSVLLLVYLGIFTLAVCLESRLMFLTIKDSSGDLCELV